MTTHFTSYTTMLDLKCAALTSLWKMKSLATDAKLECFDFLHLVERFSILLIVGQGSSCERLCFLFWIWLFCNKVLVVECSFFFGQRLF